MRRPETDLHLHLDGSLSIEVVKTLADRIGYDFGGKDVKGLLSVGENCESLPDYLKDVYKRQPVGYDKSR